MSKILQRIELRDFYWKYGTPDRSGHYLVATHIPNQPNNKFTAEYHWSLDRNQWEINQNKVTTVVYAYARKPAAPILEGEM